MKRYILYAGVNGAGKSTLYRTTNYQGHMPRVNTDEILSEFGDWRNTADLMRAGKIAVKHLHEYMEAGITFNQETTLCGHSILKMLKRAKQLGYMIEMHYVGVDSAEIANFRIARRVEAGGHGIPKEDVEKRYDESLRNLKKIISICNLTALYDNTNEFRRFAIFKDGKLVKISKDIPEWYKQWEEMEWKEN